MYISVVGLQGEEDIGVRVARDEVHLPALGVPQPTGEGSKAHHRMELRL